MSITSSSIASILNSLIQTAQTGEKDYRALVETLKTPELKHLFIDVITLHNQSATELQNELLKYGESFGEKSEETEHYPGTLREDWIDSIVGVTNKSEYRILVESERREEGLMAKYRHALENEELPVRLTALIQHQYTDIQAMHGRVRELRKRYQI